MNRSRSQSDDGGEETSSQDQHHQENERRWQQERLHREEAYYQFINNLNDEDYRLMRDHNLLGTPGEITSEELQQRLDGVKEQIASQPDLRNGTNTRDSGIPEEGSNEDSLLEWLNTFLRTGNATRSGQNGNQTWRAARVQNHGGRGGGGAQQAARGRAATPDHHPGPAGEEDSSWREQRPRQHRQQDSVSGGAGGEPDLLGEKQWRLPPQHLTPGALGDAHLCEHHHRAAAQGV